MNVYDLLNKNNATLAVIGLGQTGRRISSALAKNFKVIGYDLDQTNASEMVEGLDSLGYISTSNSNSRNLHITKDFQDLKKAIFYVITVPTPVDELGRLNLMALKEATIKVGNILKQGDYVVFESTVAPGTTEGICLPILELNSDLKVNKDFKIGYTPERIKVGELEETAASIVKIVSGSDDQALDNIGRVFRTIIPAGVHLSPSIRVAEVAQMVQSTQRDMNRALLEDFSNKFDVAEAGTLEVLAAIGMPANFLYRLGF